MSIFSRRAAGRFVLHSIFLIVLAAPAMAQQTLPNETPASFVPPRDTKSGCPACCSRTVIG